MPAMSISYYFPFADIKTVIQTMYPQTRSTLIQMAGPVMSPGLTLLGQAELAEIQIINHFLYDLGVFARRSDPQLHRPLEVGQDLP